MSVIEIDDFKIGYQETGKTDDKPPLVFLHGVGSDKSVWQNQLRYFGKSRRAIAFDYLGYNESSLATNDLSRAEIALSILAALDKLEIKRADFCGLSMGGLIALEIYKQQSEIVRSLVLANTFARHPNGAAIAARSLEFIKQNSMRAFAEQRVNHLLAPHTSESTRRQVVETMARINKQTYVWASKAVWTADYLDLLPKIAVPVLVIGGDSDEPTPPALSIELAENIKNARLEIIENAAHLSNLDQPETFNRLIQNFIKE